MPEPERDDADVVAGDAVGPLLLAGFRIEDYDISMRTPGVSLPVSSAYSPGLG